MISFDLHAVRLRGVCHHFPRAARPGRAISRRFAGIPWAKRQNADLRKFLIQTLQRHIEKKFVTAGMLEKI